MKIKAIAIILILTFLVGCKAKMNETEPSDNGSKPTNSIGGNLTLDSKKVSEHEITASSDGIITIQDENEDHFNIIIPAGAVEGDKIFEIYPVKNKKDKNNEYLSAGFYLTEKDDNDHVELKSPASISYMTGNDIPFNTVIVKYKEDGGYTIVPTQRIWFKGQNGLIAFVSGFSGYGVKTVTQAEIDGMADDMIKAGFDWVLDVDDQYKYTQIFPGEITLELNFLADLKMSMKNTTGKDSWSMEGEYKGKSDLMTAMDLTMEGQTFYIDMIGNVEEESFVLYPVPKVYEATGGGPQLVGLVPEYYVGSGVLHYKWNDTQTGKSGEDMMDIAAMFGVSGDLTDIPVAFTVITNGPIAYVTLHDFNQLDSMKFQGSIIGQGKNNEKELAPLAELVVIKSNADGGIELDKNGDGEKDLMIGQDLDGSYQYDLDGDGEVDLILELK